MDLLLDVSTSVDMEITDGLFHASVVAMRQLHNGLPSVSGHQNHSYSPIWGSMMVVWCPYMWLYGHSARCCHRMSALPWTWRSLMAYSMLSLWPWGSFTKTYQFSQVIRITPTHQSLIEQSLILTNLGCQCFSGHHASFVATRLQWKPGWLRLLSSFLVVF